MLNLASRDYSDAIVVANGTITINRAGADDATKRLDEKHEREIFKNCAPFTNYISQINNKHVDDTQDIDIVMTMSNLI